MVKGIIFVGPAGVGKTTIWQAFAYFLESQKGLTTRRVNMDPGSHVARDLVEYDVTSDIYTRDLMKTQRLGPNGAILEACRRMYEQRTTLFQKILQSNESSPDYILIDTPGQLDSFILQPYGAAFFNELNEHVPLSAIYLFDASAMRDPVNVPTQLFLNAATIFQFTFELTPCLSKADLVDVQNIIPLLQDPQYLQEKIQASRRGVLSDLAIQSLDLISKFRLPVRIVPISVYGNQNSGLEDLFSILEESECSCGDRL